MKLHIIISFVIAIPILTSGCEKENKIMACGLEDPLKNIEWLQELKNDIEINNEIDAAEIVIFSKENIDYFYVQQHNTSSHDLPNGRVFNCEGIIKYSCGGNQPVDSCIVIFMNAQKKETIWEKY